MGAPGDEMKNFVVSISLEADKKVPGSVRIAATPVSGKEYESFALGATDPARTTVYMDVGNLWVVGGPWGFKRLFLNTLDHEYAHAFSVAGDTSNEEEEMAQRFERAGAWTRDETFKSSAAYW
jgi:hypothetical protein